MEDGINTLIAGLQDLKGKAFWQRLVAITERFEFKEIEKGVFSAANPGNPDFDRLLTVAHKARAFGYIVYILPNPRGVSSADFIFRNKNSYKLYELKTIYGKNSLGNRLHESVEQSDRVVLNLTNSYKIRRLADDITRHFKLSSNAREVLIFFRRQRITIMRTDADYLLWKKLMKHFK